MSSQPDNQWNETQQDQKHQTFNSFMKLQLLKIDFNIFFLLPPSQITWPYRFGHGNLERLKDGGIKGERARDRYRNVLL